MIPAQLLNHLWQSTLFAVAAGLLTLALRKNRAPVRYWLWFAASCKFLIPFSLLVTIGSQVEWRKAQAVQSAPIPYVMERISEPFAPPAPARPVAEKPPVSVSTVLLFVWLGGLSVVVCSWFRQWRRLRTALRIASPLHLNLPIRIMSSPARLEPGVFGIFRPVLLVPEGITDRLTPAQWEAILAHELCHVRRHDNLTAAIHMAVEAVFWFYPLAWWIGKRLVDERERACDEEVLSLGSEPQVYPEGILNVCKLYVESPLRCVSGVTGSDLKGRIRTIMTERVAVDLNFAKKVVLTLAGTAVLSLPVGVGLMNAPAIRAQSPSAASREFEVASVKVSPDIPDERNTLAVSGGPGSNDPERITFKHCPLKYLVLYAFGLPFDRVTFESDPQVVGPSWIADGEKYEIIAKIPPGTSTEQFRLMLQNLLVARFKAVFRRESKEISGYELTVAKGGTKLKESPDPNAPPTSALGFELDRNGFPIVPAGSTGLVAARGYVTARNKSIEDLIKFVAIKLSVSPSAIIDGTGLSRTYDFAFQTEAGNPLFPSVKATDAPSIFEALEKQLGLKLEKRKVVAQILVVEHAERVPTEN